jgi:multiple sugar transport system ATP-binding protein
VQYGIRPGDIRLSTPDNGIGARIVVVEPTGAETELLLEVGGETLIVVLHGRTDVRPDDRVGLVIDGANAHLFDEGSGQRVE